MPSVDVYMIPLSPPCRSVLLAAKACGVDVNQVPLDPRKGEHMTPEFLKINPAHTIPTLKDGEFCLNESRAIMAYLVGKYAADKSLYPADLEKRAIVDARLYYDMNIWSIALSVFAPVVFGPATSLNDAFKERLVLAFKTVEDYLTRDGPYVAGKDMTIADFAMIASISSIMAIDLIPMDDFPKIKAWVELCKTSMAGYAEANGGPGEEFGSFIKGKLAEKIKA